MHDSMTLGALLIGPLQGLPGFSTNDLARLAAVGATALFASAPWRTAVLRRLRVYPAG
jgi:hypothetical protein